MEAFSSARRPRTRFVAWLTDPCAEVSPAIRAALIERLFGTLPIFLAAVVNSIIVAVAIAVQMQSLPFLIWAIAEVVITAVRLPLLIACKRAHARGRRGPIGAYIGFSLCWALVVGIGAMMSMWSGNWVVATLACISAAGMVGGVCFRNFASPRFAAAMVIACFGPLAIGGIASGEAILLVTALQVPMYLVVMVGAAFRINGMMIATMRAEEENAHRAQHDPLTGLLNRSGLAEAAAALPAEAPLACYFVDLDGFKRVNDTLGHLAGDALLAAVAQRLREIAGADAILARPGGDEFVLVAPCRSAAAARATGEGIAAAVAGAPYVIESQGVLIGASVGAALRTGAATSLDALIGQADEALYLAKEHGSSSCVVAGDPPPPAPRDDPAAAAPPLRVVNG